MKLLIGFLPIWSVVGVSLLLGLLDRMAAGAGTRHGVKEYFFGEEQENEVFADISNITWAHAVNSIAKLQKALNDDSMMLEADISLGTVNGTGEEIAIMAHPPANTSDLSFEDFIRRVIHAVTNGAKKGVKLDFKDIRAVQPCLTLLKKLLKRQITFPVWLNADILSGPVNATGQPVNATEFLALTQKYAPSSMLSLGWTTNFGCSVRGKYDKEQVDEMIELLDNYNLQVPPTFPVRAGLAAESLEELLLLQASVPGSTLTLWASASDPVNMTNLETFIDTVKKNNLYIDLPFNLTSGPGDNCSDNDPPAHDPPANDPPAVAEQDNTHVQNGTRAQNDTVVDNSIVPSDDSGSGALSYSTLPLLLVGLGALMFGSSF